MLQAGKYPSFPLLLNRMQFKSTICSKKNPDRAREVTLKYFLQAFLSQEGKIMLKDSNFEHRSKILTVEPQIEQHLQKCVEERDCITTDDLRQEAELKRSQLPQDHPELSTNLNQLRESKDYYFQIMKWFQQQHCLSDILNIRLKYMQNC
ncbi:Hypothetical_protein [Hexamita inflata]|uniref:Hypothetical_protein n=1 Tax=Hexamita inflata TaxID=28002 RepID=A0AA86PDQ8_9EUKA|nr:Hypothetical protein HINF_LOCUS24830 [Hexamita inflata]CAI9953997.1 Hypothetical protein HINF_LOCUS41642 [Hexamita inflata]